MANELYYTSSATVSPYAIIRKKSDGTVWNGSAFESFTNGNITTYGITLSSLGGDLYGADFPTAISSGDYLVVVYDKAGGSFAITDDRLAAYPAYWNGATVTNTAPSGTDYVSLSALKTYLGISDTANDTQYSALISTASRAVESYCGRVFSSANYVEYYNGSRTHYNSYIKLLQYPVTAITRVATYPQDGLWIGNNTAQAANAQVSSGNLILNRWNSGVLTTSTLSLSTYITLTTLAAAVNALGNGWTATAQIANYPSAFLKTMTGSLDCVSSTAAITVYTETLSNYRFDETTGTLFGHFPEGFKNIEVRYSAGYSTIPLSIQQATAEIAKTMLDLTRTDNAMDSERIGDYAYNVKDLISSGDIMAIVNSTARTLLAPYRNDLLL